MYGRGVLQNHANHHFVHVYMKPVLLPGNIVDSDNSPKVVVTRSEFVLEDNKLQTDTVYTRRIQQEKRINRSLTTLISPVNTPITKH